MPNPQHQIVLLTSNYDAKYLTQFNVLNFSLLTEVRKKSEMKMVKYENMVKKEMNKDFSVKIVTLSKCIYM